MEFVAILAGLAAMVICWVLLVKSMRINGRPMWWRHFAAASWSPITFTGTALLVGSLLGVTDEQGVSWGFSGIFAGLLVLIPVIVAMSVSRGAAKRKQLKSLVDDKPKTGLEVPQPKAKAERTETLEQSLEKNRQTVRAAIQQRRGKRTSAYLPPRPASTTGNLRFMYRDAEGNESTRELTNFKLNSGKVRGFCLGSQAIRTFRLDRIMSFIEGEAQLYATEASPEQRLVKPDVVRSGDPEVTFSGYDAKTRAELEKTAEAHGFIVRKSVTKNLDYFVAGPRRSAAKVAEAEDKPGCSVIDKEGFLWLVATGEVNHQ